MGNIINTFLYCPVRAHISTIQPITHYDISNFTIPKRMSMSKSFNSESDEYLTFETHPCEYSKNYDIL